ncbi:MAG: hypothetical protein J7623_20640 [Chitinophaga sp.]|uniref:hypothetical protein n=1 Tax=Chitinophaga sp. TaxID=1869181 RepID=UPI001B1CF752|nr:hypothetical protein [Chitinophaga sp.]MBO9731057.1 hypothetical protein [Chitinophaga sp.]
MKLLRHFFYVLIAVMILPAAQGPVMAVQKTAVNSIHEASATAFKAALKAPRYHTAITRFKRRPVGINDSYGHEKVCPPLLSEITARFIYVDKIHAGFYFNPYLSIPISLRSWRGPPTA